MKYTREDLEGKLVRLTKFGSDTTGLPEGQGGPIVGIVDRWGDLGPEYVFVDGRRRIGKRHVLYADEFEIFEFTE